MLAGYCEGPLARALRGMAHGTLPPPESVKYTSFDYRCRLFGVIDDEHLVAVAAAGQTQTQTHHTPP